MTITGGIEKISQKNAIRETLLHENYHARGYHIGKTRLNIETNIQLRVYEDMCRLGYDRGRC